jgi:hypothetical protein
VLNFEIFAGVGLFPPPPPSIEPGYPLECLEPGQSLIPSCRHKGNYSVMMATPLGRFANRPYNTNYYLFDGNLV